MLHSFAESVELMRARRKLTSFLVTLLQQVCLHIMLASLINKLGAAMVFRKGFCGPISSSLSAFRAHFMGSEVEQEYLMVRIHYQRDMPMPTTNVHASWRVSALNSKLLLLTFAHACQHQ